MKDDIINGILNNDKRFLLVMIPIILILSSFVLYALIPSFYQGNIEDNIIDLIEKSTNDTLSLLTNDTQDTDVESEVVSSQNSTNSRTDSSTGSNTGSNTGSSDTSETSTQDTPSTPSTDEGQPTQDVPSEPSPAVDEGGSSSGDSSSGGEGSQTTN